MRIKENEKKEKDQTISHVSCCPFALLRNSKHIRRVKGRAPFSSSSSFHASCPWGWGVPSDPFGALLPFGQRWGGHSWVCATPEVRRPSTVVVQSHLIPHVCKPNAWAQLSAGQTYRKAKPREDGPLETIFRDPPKAVSEVVTWGTFWEFLRDFIREMEFGGGGGQNVPRWREVGNCFRGGSPHE